MQRTGLALTFISGLLFSAVAGTLLSKTAMAKTITVPDLCPTIQEAVNHASAGNMFVRAGNYDITVEGYHIGMLGAFVGLSIY
jgi:hypothetical protein